jgi:hypothetical protein
MVMSISAINEDLLLLLLTFFRICITFCLLDQGNVGLIFTKGDLKEVSEEVAKDKVEFLKATQGLTLRAM